MGLSENQPLFTRTLTKYLNSYKTYICIYICIRNWLVKMISERFDTCSGLLTSPRRPAAPLCSQYYTIPLHIALHCFTENKQTKNTTSQKHTIIIYQSAPMPFYVADIVIRTCRHFVQRRLASRGRWRLVGQVCCQGWSCPGPTSPRPPAVTRPFLGLSGHNWAIRGPHQDQSRPT